MFNNLTIKLRLIIMISFLSVLTIIIGLLGLRGMNIANEGLRTVYEDRLIPAGQLGEVNILTAENLRQMHLMLMHDPRLPESKLHDHPLSKHLDAMAENTKRNNKLIEDYAATYLTPEEKQLFEDYQAKRKIYQDVRKKTQQLIEEGKYAEANASMVKETAPAFIANRDAVKKLLELQINVGKEEHEKALQAYATTRNISISAITLGILLAALLGVMLIRKIVGSLDAAQKIAGAIACGDLSSDIDTSQKDEVGVLLSSMNTMQDSLRAIVADIQTIVEDANKGDFSKKIAMEGKAGYTKTLSELLNQLSNTVDGAFEDTIRVAEALSKGDLSQKVTKEYAGAYNQVKVSVNTTADSLTKIVGEIQRIVEAATKGDFSIKMDLSGKLGYTKTLSELLNLLSDTVDEAFKDTILVAQALAKGDLTKTVTRDYQGAYNEVKQSVNGTVSNLKELVGQIKDATDTINTASREIASGNSDLSQRTEEQASSLEETASSMEELTSTVKQNTENAKQANQLAISASDVAGKGGAVVGQVVTTMDSINESSRKIVDIISVIDGIAFQTNILALNAAVEAARAGEQGRGFAVVAGEVRNLAQRSAAAAKEIKTLIGDSVEKVEGGSKLVAQAGQTMEEIVTSIKRVTDIMSEITAASVEQSQGIEQVNTAITQMDEVTQQNAALVEEAAAAAESLEEQAQNLAASVGTFKVDEKAGQAVAIRAPAAAQAAPAAARHAPTPAHKALAQPKAAPAKHHVAAKPKPASGEDGDWKEF